MLRLPPIARISLGLVSTTLALMIVADVLFGLSPDHVRPTLDARKRLTETLAIQVTALINSGDIEAVQETLRTIVERQPDVLSSGVRLASGPLVVKVGDHDNLWKGAGGDRSTPTHARVKIHHGAAQWGTLEVRFQSLASAWSLAVVHNPFVKALVFVSLAGFAAYLVFMRRTLRHLDPASVIPERVKATLDLLSEGVVIADEQDRIVLVNKAFEEGCGISMRSLLGRDLSSLPWHAPSDEAGIHLMPWHAARRDGTSRTGTRLELGDAERRVYAVNSVPMLDDRGQAGGVMVTFDDLTELESTHLDLRETMHELQRSRNEIAQQNERLEILATRDPLTNCLNRRALNEQIESTFELAQISDAPVGCIMSDIDHFKSVNDMFGHQVGDQAIQFVASVFHEQLRATDVVGRYGGEEFCVLLYGCSLDEVRAIAEKLRASIEATSRQRVPALGERRLTASFGVAATPQGAGQPMQLVSQADKALYLSKRSGRNRVSAWIPNDSGAQAVG
jgi:diguanylate cyclase (GGDEF)-like protein/PAS domain S-box-containing protein